MKTRFQISRKRPASAPSTKASCENSVRVDVRPLAASRLRESASRPRCARDRRRSRCTGRTGPCPPSARSCPARRARRCGDPGARRSPSTARAPRRRSRCTVTRRCSVGMPSSVGDELPREANRVALEVVAEREVAEHLEEGVVPRRVAHLLEIVVLAARAHALLRGGARARRPTRAPGRGRRA